MNASRREASKFDRWEDRSSYRAGRRGIDKPSTFELTIDGYEITLTRHIALPPTDWKVMVLSPQRSEVATTVITGDKPVKAAKRLALKFVRRELKDAALKTLIVVNKLADQIAKLKPKK